MKAAAQRDQESPQRDMVGHIGMADGAEVNGVVQPEPVEPIFGHHPPGLSIALAAPVEFIPAEFKSVGACRALHRGNAFGHNFVPDPVAGDYCYAITLCHAIPPTRRPVLFVGVPNVGGEQPVTADLTPDDRIFADDLLGRLCFGFESNGADLARRPRAQRQYVEGYELGVADFLSRPFPE